MKNENIDIQEKKMVLEAITDILIKIRNREDLDIFDYRHVDRELLQKELLATKAMFINYQKSRLN